MRRAAGALAAALLIAGCGAPRAEAEAPAPAPPSSPAATVATTPAQPPAVPATLRFTGRTLDGRDFDASTLAGRPAILWFWAPWCATCASEAMSIADIAEEYRGRIGILGIAGMGSSEDMHEFVTDLEVAAVTHLDDGAGRLWKRFAITQQSWYVLVDRAGTVVHTGYLDDLQLTARVKALVA